MTDYKLLLNEVTIEKKHLKIDLVLLYEECFTIPKIRILFTKGLETRRMPLLLRSTFKKKNDGRYISVFNYSYSIPNLFIGNESEEDISLSFEVALGESFIEQSPFFVSKGIAIKDNVNDKYIAGKEFSGSLSYNNYSQPEPEEDTESDFSYDFKAEPENNRIIISCKQNEIKKESRLFLVCSFIANIITGILNLVLCIAILPYFILNGILSGLGLIRKNKFEQTDNPIINIIGQIKTNIAQFLRFAYKSREIALNIIKPGELILRKYYSMLLKKPIKQNQIAIVSGRRNELGGNEKFVYDLIKDKENLNFEFLLVSNPEELIRFKNRKRFYKLYATSKVVIVDDYFTLLNRVKKREEVTLFQFWHACGAFKTFGFSRIGKPGGPKQTSPDHRMYNYATVSSEGIRKYYAEGFGLNDSSVIATGIPRTDIFFDDDYRSEITGQFYLKHPELKSKKIILFAPTFRGNGQNGAYYPIDVFNPEKLLDKIGNDYAVIIKLHPFCKERYQINPDYSDRLIDLSDEDELNDLLFITDLLITDYSSSVFEASLIDIPMLFYPYDLYQYISERDFYCDFESFVPGKIVFNQEDLESAIINEDFEKEKVEPFKNKFFTYTDGKSSQRVAEAVLKEVGLTL